ncbi:MAG: 30S ribosomal protein S8 [Deltaproteobacteria bacterium]|nr:30S ribosomal protein S8 [Deltaproteobacteria bacterium]MBW2421521.1 30S ribosomal protein S8 [Deltaproteobacteria bacterium]
MMTDPIGDMLTRIRNAGGARHTVTRCPSSKLKEAVAQVLSEEGFIGDVSIEGDEGRKNLVLGIRYRDDGSTMIDSLQRVSKPGRRVYVGAKEVPRVRNGLGMVVLSTSKGVMCDRSAREASVGGEVICEVW